MKRQTPPPLKQDKPPPPRIVKTRYIYMGRGKPRSFSNEELEALTLYDHKLR